MTTLYRPDDNPYVGLFEPHAQSRPVMSRPPRMIASQKLRDTIRHARERNPTEAEFADWLANFMEEYGALFAKPVFDMDGTGPQCSFCAAIWPLCGHHHMSAEIPVDEEETP